MTGVNVANCEVWKRATAQAMFMSMIEDDKKDRLDRQIDENLRKVYREQMDVEVPDRFRDLLDKLREQDAQE